MRLKPVPLLRLDRPGRAIFDFDLQASPALLNTTRPYVGR